MFDRTQLAILYCFENMYVVVSVLTSIFGIVVQNLVSYTITSKNSLDSPLTG